MAKKQQRNRDGQRANPPRGDRKRQGRTARVTAPAPRATTGATGWALGETPRSVADHDQMRSETTDGNTVGPRVEAAARDDGLPTAADAVSSRAWSAVPSVDVDSASYAPPMEPGPPADASIGSGVRAIRRTRTLADVVQPGRPTPRGLSAFDPAEAQQAPPMRSARSAQFTDTMPTLPRVRAPRETSAPSTQPVSPHQPRRTAPDTRPISDDNVARVRRFPRDEAARLTRRLTDRPTAHPTRALATDPLDAHEPDTLQLRPQRRGAPGLVERMALGHACIALVVAITASVLLVRGDLLGFWLLGLVLLALPGAVLAYVLLVRDRRVVRAGDTLLVATQLGALGWAFVVLGPRVELVLLVPACIWQAQRLGGRPVAAFAAVGATTLTLAFTCGRLFDLYRPVVVFDDFAASLLAAACATFGLGLVLWAVLDTAVGREKSELLARVRLYELRLLRAELTHTRAQIEHEAEQVGNALVAALHGKGIDPITVDGSLGPVGEITNAIADRLSTLQKDREDRIRQEGALRIVIRAVERGWLGLSWTWPDASGTIVDDLVALLRTPSPREYHAATWNDDMPTLVPLSSASYGSRYWRSPFMPSGPSAPSGPGSSAPGMAQARFGWDDLLGR